MTQQDAFVQGFLFESVAAHSRDGHVCEIVAREEGDGSLLEFGPAFRVRFGDGHEEIAFASELHPWYPT